jgi:hypothetical protein
MENNLIIALLLIAIAIIIVVVVHLKRKASTLKNTAKNTDEIPSTISNALTVGGDGGDMIIDIPIELLPATTQLDETRLTEIKDSTVIARISQTIPATAQYVANTVAKRVVQETINNPQMYLVKIPSNATLVNPTKKGVQYAFYKGAKGGSAQLVKADVSKVTKATTLANGVANIMNVGSLVVGQYYMSEISSKLETMTKSIDKVGDFQDREFKSRILSVITLVGEISRFSSEILENDDQRKLKLAALDDRKSTATELLGQVNITIAEITQKNPNPKYEDYQSIVGDFKKLVEYQNVLTAVLAEISKLTYLLGKGEISVEQSYIVYNDYCERSTQTRNLLRQWHDRQVKALRIDLDKERVSKAGFEAVVSAIPGLIDEKYKYIELRRDFADEINAQTNAVTTTPDEPKQVYDEDVQIIIRDGKYFYLPQPTDTENNLTAEDNS